MRRALFIAGIGLVGIYSYDFVAGKVNNQTGKDTLPQVWGIFSTPQMINYYFNEVWIFVAGLTILFFLAASA